MKVYRTILYSKIPKRFERGASFMLDGYDNGSFIDVLPSMKEFMECVEDADLSEKEQPLYIRNYQRFLDWASKYNITSIYMD